MSIPAYPLQWPQGWPRSRARKVGQFGKTKTNYSNVPGGGSWKKKADITMADAVERVRYELERLGVNVADDSIVSTNLKLNLSGLPRGDQGEPEDPGVAVYFQKKIGPMRVIAIDASTRVRDNVAAIAATLEAMRAIERHGGAQILERAFTGFAALSAPKQWWDILQVKADASRDVIEANFRRLARDRHPDAGGSNAAMAELNEARAAGLAARW
ncbi:J domain-containing protein [Bradyrhizobium sp.]|uniref:J domain-containing protein n=1 Tax=Bradyrhizobium sp. TaxID=376 RepID=UPI002613C1FB|nr:J domain-containing protein [Bradyrhizobium sp.]